MSAPRVLIFDSGVGGLSISDEIARLHPHCALFYCSDNGFYPYGTKTEAQLVERVEMVLRAATELYAIDIIVVACNSASTLALPHIRRNFDMPIIGVVPAIKPAAELTRTGHIALLATEATVVRPYTDQLINDFAPRCQVHRKGCQALVQLAEDKLRNKAVDLSILDGTLRALFFDRQGIGKLAQKPIDTMVLACTHFPLLKDEIAQWLKSNIDHPVTLIDSGVAIANRVGYWLEQPGIFSEQADLESTALFTQSSADLKLLELALTERGYAKTMVV